MINFYAMLIYFILYIISVQQTRQMVGQIEVDSRLSKQIARGKMHVRVTSRDGQTMIGVLRPRLLRQGMRQLFLVNGGFAPE